MPRPQTSPGPASSAGDRTNWVLFALLGGIWGSSFMFIKIGDQSLSPLTLVTLRLLFGSIFLAGALRAFGASLPRDPQVLRRLALIAVFNIVVPFTLITWGERSIDSGVAAILNATMPLFTIVVAALALPEEPITVNRLAGLVVGFGGVVLLVSRSLGSSGSLFAGELAVALAALSYASATVYVRLHLRGVPPVSAAAGQVGIALPIAAVLAITTEHPWTLAPHPDALFAVVWLGILGSGAAYLISFRLIAHWDATRMSLVTYLFPAVGVALGTTFLGERVGWQEIAGGLLVVAGVALVNGRFGRRRLIGRRAAAPAPSLDPDPSA